MVALMADQLFEKAWERYAKFAVHPQASGAQKRETRRAFYAGAIALFDTIMKRMTPDAEVTEEDTQALDNLARELEAFSEDAIAGRT
jgi:hypothetical protein